MICLASRRKQDPCSCLALPGGGRLWIPTDCATRQLTTAVASLRPVAREGIFEAPQWADIAQLKRLICYNTHNKLKPSLQVGCDTCALQAPL
jgi:hypothetical protein